MPPDVDPFSGLPVQIFHKPKNSQGSTEKKDDPDVWDPPTPPNNPRKAGGVMGGGNFNNNKWQAKKNFEM